MIMANGGLLFKGFRNSSIMIYDHYGDVWTELSAPAMVIMSSVGL